MQTETLLTLLRENWPDGLTLQGECVLMTQRLAALLRENAERALAPHGLGFTEFEVLAALRTSPPPHELFPTALYDAVVISSGGLTKVLKGLEARGLVTRPPSAGDRRRRPIALAPAGACLVVSAMSSVQAADAAALGDALPEPEYRRLHERLGTLLRALEKNGPAPAEEPGRHRSPLGTNGPR